MAAALAIVVLLIAWLMTHAEAGHQQADQAVVGSR
jgi:hypothetical protein